MALGTYNSNKFEKNNYSPSVYSAYRMGNPESEVDPSMISFSFWNNMLKISILPRKQTKDANDISYDTENSISIYLTHTKARMLYDEICKFQENPDLYQNLGVPSGEGLIYICNGKEFKINCPCIVIKKINGETGETMSSYAYQLKKDYHYSIRNFDSNSNDFDKIYHNNIELEEFKTLLRSYYEAMSGAMAYSVVDNLKYDFSRLNTKIELIADKLGVEFRRKGSGNVKSSTSIFNTKEPRNFSSLTIDDIEDQIG